MFTASRIVPSTIAILVLTALAGAAKADRTFTSLNWNAASWETIQYGPGSASSARDATGGNPGAALQVTMTASTSGGALNGFQHNVGGNQYNPAVDGAVASIDFSLDARWISSSLVPGGHGLSIGIQQGGIDYASNPTQPTGFTGNWVTLTDTGLTASDFTRLDGLPGTPDFSAGGASFSYGFRTFIAGFNHGNSNIVNYDNLSMTVHSTPAPGAAALAGLGGLLASRRRRPAASL